MKNELKKKYGLLTAIAMVAGIVIGSGVFFKAQIILQKTKGNMPLGILAWAIGGAIMLFCILAFAIMATKYEKVNGIIDYAEATVGNKYGYIIGWFMTWIYYPTLTSVLAWLSARYTLTFIASASESASEYLGGADGCATGPECMVLALFFLCAAFAINTLSPKIAGHFQVTTTFIKLIPLVLMAVVGIIYGLTSKNGTLIQNFTTKAVVENSGVLNVSPIFASVAATSFAYEGWIIATSINSELKNSKKNLPIALVAGGLLVVVIYIAYYIGVAGGATNQELITDGATVAFTNVFGKVFGTVLNVFVAVSCMGTLNGLMLGCTRGMYSVTVRGRGPSPKMYASVDKETNMPSNSSVLGLLICAVWFVFFYGANLASKPWFGFFSFDSSELPIVTIYALYIPIFIMFMKKAKDLNPLKRFVIPCLAIAGSIFMIIAAVFAHGIQPYAEAKANGTFSCPILAYLIVFAVVVIIGLFFMNKKIDDDEKPQLTKSKAHYKK